MGLVPRAHGAASGLDMCAGDVEVEAHAWLQGEGGLFSGIPLEPLIILLVDVTM